MFGIIRNKHGELIDYGYLSGDLNSQEIIVLGHGVTGNKDRPLVTGMAEGLAALGFPTLRISFAGNGDSEGRFVDCTITKEAEDLGAVLDALPGRQITYIGHSMGAAVGVTHASQDARIKRLVSLAGMVHTKDFAQREFGQVTPGQGCMWDEPACPLSQVYVDDMNRIGSVVQLAPKIRVPWLLVHGSADDVVPLQDSQDIFAQAQQPKQLVVIPNADHRFSGEFLPVAIQAVASWLKAVSF